MKWIILPTLWIAALVVALLIVRRVRSGNHVVVTGRYSPRMIRMIVVVLVLLGVGGEKSANQANAYPLTPLKDNPNDPMPTLPVMNWLSFQTPNGTWVYFKKSATIVLMKATPTDADFAALMQRISIANSSPMFHSIFKSHIEAIKMGKEPPRVVPGDALSALDQMEKYGFYDHWLNAYLWRRTSTDDPKKAKELTELYRRFQQHARITDTLIAAYGQVRPLLQGPRPWASKAGPRPHEMEQVKAYQLSIQEMTNTAVKLYATTDDGTWKHDGLILLSPVKDSPAPNLLKAGKLKGFVEGEKNRVGRLDLIETPKDKTAVLEHEWLGKIELPAGRIISVWEMPKYLSKDGEDKLRAAIVKALDGDEKSADQVEKVLPLAHVELRAALKETPKAKGASRLRMILSLFDDAIMPQVTEPKGGERGALGEFPDDGPGRLVPR